MNGAKIGRGAVVGAGAVVTENMTVPDLGLVVGLPGKVIKTLPNDTYEKNVKWAKKYVQLAAIQKYPPTGLKSLLISFSGGRTLKKASSKRNATSQKRISL